MFQRMHPDPLANCPPEHREETAAAIRMVHRKMGLDRGPAPPRPNTSPRCNRRFRGTEAGR
jgi:hypothetical protein